MEADELKEVAETLIAEIDQAMRAEVREAAEAEEDSHPEPRDYVYASGYEPCTRAMSIAMTGARVPFDDDARVRMEMGKERERAARIRMEKAEQFAKTLGFELIHGQKRIALTGADDTKIISGKCEGEIEIKWKGRMLQVPWEIKDWYPPTVQRIHEFKDLLRVSRWTRKAAYQFAAYLWGADREVGLFMLNQKGMPKFLWTTYEECLPLAEEFWGRAEEAREYQRKNEIPPIPTDTKVCDQCQYRGKHCFPPSIAPGGEVELDDEAVEKVARYAEIEATRKEGDRLWKFITQRYRDRPRVFCGRAVVEGKRNKDRMVEAYEGVPPEVQRKVHELRAEAEQLVKPFAVEERVSGNWNTKVTMVLRDEEKTDDIV
jgi:CRISPR/Cas system-associated exonuclease Cas4 (RecB family)